MKLVNKIEDACSELLAGKGHAIQGAVMACLVARHLASFEGETRLEAERILWKTAAELVAVYEGPIRKDAAKRARH